MKNKNPKAERYTVRFCKCWCLSQKVRAVKAKVTIWVLTVYVPSAPVDCSGYWQLSMKFRLKAWPVGAEDIKEEEPKKKSRRAMLLTKQRRAALIICAIPCVETLKRVAIAPSDAVFHFTHEQWQKKALMMVNLFVVLLQLCESLATANQNFGHVRNSSSDTARQTTRDKARIQSNSKISRVSLKSAQKPVYIISLCRS